MLTERYLDPHQARQRAPTAFEDLLGDALERAFADGAHTLPELVARLNLSGLAHDGGTPWTEDDLQALLARLGN